ncbi:MAG: hypothetical protein KC668_30940, partial [Myxococcales bacterium]|nr:hypothetical protein [Myxococcales bacterium]
MQLIISAIGSGKFSQPFPEFLLRLQIFSNGFVNVLVVSFPFPCLTIHQVGQVTTLPNVNGTNQSHVHL